MAREKKTESVTIKTTPAIKAKLDKIAEREDRTLSYIVNKIVEEALEKKENKPS